MAGKSIILDGQVIHGRDRFGDWRVNALDGWNDTPPPKGPAVEREGDDGEYDLPTQYAARTVTLSGRLLARSAADAANARNRLNGLLPRRNGRLQVTGADGKPVWADVKRNGPSTGKITGAILRFSFELKAVDPRKYGDANVFTVAAGQSVDLHHYGNADAYPIFDITGDMPSGWTLWGPSGKAFVAPSAVAADRAHRLDMSEGLLKVRGYYWTGQTGQSDLWTVPPGQLVATRFTGAGAGTAKVTVYDTYI